ncbi:histidine kinase [Streptomyces sp. NPDC049954]|uniref:sensor histidine kinase n=1 Tax=Streptomyces sp. NPDC049954 TaxID=3155779 RepID=UPI00343907D1
MALLPGFSLNAGRVGEGKLRALQFLLRPLLRNVSHSPSWSALGPWNSGVLRAKREPSRVSAARETVRQEERRRLGRDLHDTLAPHLALLRLRMEAVDETMETASEETLHLLGQYRQDVSQAIGALRAMIRALNTDGSLRNEEAGSLSQFLKAQASLLRAATDERLQVSLDLSPDLDGLPPDVQSELQYIAGEALANAVRHAHPSQVRVRVSVWSGDDSAFVELSVADDGQGISSGRPEGLGFSSMCLRSKRLGGTFSVRENEPHGTVVLVGIPFVRFV